MDPFTSRKPPTGPSNGVYRLNQPMSRQTATAPRPINEARAAALKGPTTSFDPLKPSFKPGKQLNTLDCLDEAVATEMLAGMEPIEPMLRASGQFGSERGPLRADADATDRLMSFIGRDPYWSAS